MRKDNEVDRGRRRSTSCFHVYVAGVFVTGASRTQGVVATSSGEAEVRALNLGAAEAFYAAQVAQFMSGQKAKVTLCTDASAAVGSLHRLGPGSRLKHVEIQELWLQEIVRDKRATLSKIRRDVNTADLGTKSPAKADLDKMLALLGYQRKDDLIVDEEYHEREVTKTVGLPSGKGKASNAVGVKRALQAGILACQLQRGWAAEVKGILEGITPSWTEIAVTMVVLAYVTTCWLREPRRTRREQGVQVSNSGRTLGVQTRSDTRNQGTQTEADVCDAMVQTESSSETQRPPLVRMEAPPPTEAQWGYYQRLCRDTRIAPRTDLNRQTMSREIDLLLARLGRG